jgi:hypothetical protein
MIKRLINSFEKRKQKISDQLSLKVKPDCGYVALCCIIKDENEYLEEWINYHLKIGIEHFYIYDNGSKIPIRLTLEKNDLLKYATVIYMPGKARQVKAYAHCLKNFGKSYKWIGFIDTDEFIVPKLTNGDFKAFLTDFEPYGGLGINWMVFGSSGHLKRTKLPQLESFLLRADESFNINVHIKSIVQPEHVQSVLGSHNFEYKEGKFCVNENFEHIDGPFSKTSVNKIQLNHYYCRSLEEYQLKVTRGYGDTRKKRSIDEFFRHDRHSNEVKDTKILEILNAFKEVAQ